MRKDKRLDFTLLNVFFEIENELSDRPNVEYFESLM